MPAIKSSRASKTKNVVRGVKRNWLGIFAIGIISTGVICGTGYYVMNKVVVPRVKSQAIAELKGEGKKVFVASRNIAFGEPLDGAVMEIGSPDYLVPDDVYGIDLGLNGKTAMEDITKGTMLTYKNVYDPYVQDAIIQTSRNVVIKYLDITNLKDNDYIDIRIVIQSEDGSVPFRDETVVAKKRVKKLEDGSGMIITLSEGEILNLSDAVVLAANDSDKIKAELYTTTYVNPNTQHKGTVTYDGKGSALTKAEIDQATKKLEEKLKSGNSSTGINSVSGKLEGSNTGVNSSINTTKGSSDGKNVDGTTTGSQDNNTETNKQH